MASVEEQIQTQLRNIESKTGKSQAELFALVRECGLSKHGEIVAHLKSTLGLGHGDANTLAHKARASDGASVAAEKTALGTDPAEDWYAGPKAALRPIHDAVLGAVSAFGGDIEHSPKKGYVSLRRKKQFATVGPATQTQVEVGLNLKGESGDDRVTVLPAGGMCTHRVRLGAASEVDAALVEWLRRAYDRSG